MTEGTETVGPMSAVEALEALRARKRERDALPAMDGSQPPPLLDRSSADEANRARRLLFRGSTVQLARRSMGRSDRMAAVLGAHARIRQEVNYHEDDFPETPFPIPGGEIEYGEPSR